MESTRTADLRRRITDIIVQPELSDTFSLFSEFRYSDFTAGDTVNRFQLSYVAPLEQQSYDGRQYRLGGRYEPMPGLTFLGVWIDYNASEQVNRDGTKISLINQHVDQNTGEAGAYLVGDHFNLIAGAGASQGTDDKAGGGVPCGDLCLLPTRDESAWLYGKPPPRPPRAAWTGCG